MRKIALLLFAAGALLASCKKEEAISEAVQKPVEKASIVGKKFLYNYGDLHYEITVKNDSVLNWNCVFGSEKGKSDDEIYHTQSVSDQILLLSWIEKDGLGVNQAINFDKDSVYTFLKIDKEVIPLKGSVEEIK